MRLDSAQAPGLPFLRNLSWVEAPIVTDDKILHRLIAALKGETIVTATPLWNLVNPYRGLEATTEANADYFHGRTVETATVLTALADHPVVGWIKDSSGSYEMRLYFPY
jgi:hypothetical protein